MRKHKWNTEVHDIMALYFEISQMCFMMRVINFQDDWIFVIQDV